MNYDPYYPLVLFHVSVIRSKWAASMISSDSSVTKIKDKKNTKIRLIYLSFGYKNSSEAGNSKRNFENNGHRAEYFSGETEGTMNVKIQN